MSQGTVIQQDSYTVVSDPQRLPAAPVVSVLMLAYNHGAWIADAIESVLVQECGFEYELIIGEDGSTDDTRAIALRYQERYPNRIRVVLPQCNMGAVANLRRICHLARGDFIAYCEGDDYWCHPGKLAAQVELMRANPGLAMVHADWVRSRRCNDTWRVDWKRPMHQRVPERRLVGDLFSCFYYPRILRTCTVLQRRSAVQEFFASWLGDKNYLFGDTVISAFLTAGWEVGYWPEIAAVYRESPNSTLRSGRRAFVGFLRSSLRFDTDARRYFDSRRDYPISYRWENDLGLLINGMRLGDLSAVREALRDFAVHYGPLDFCRAALAALRMRWPGFSRTPRALPPPMGA